jgi:ferredoxin
MNIGGSPVTNIISMAIPTSRTKEPAKIFLDEEKCTGCGVCEEVCSDGNFKISEGKARVTQDFIFGCIGCGHCMAACPEDAIRIEGRFISPADLFPLPGKESASSFESLMNLYNRRRSVREFRDTPVDKEQVEKILAAAMTAPMGIPPSDVHMVVLDSKEKVRGFVKDYCDALEKMKWLVSGWFLALMRPFWGKSTDELFRKFLRPLIYSYTSHFREGRDKVMYDAPVALYFYTSPFTDPADPIIACTYAMIAAESLGLGTCMLGGIHPFIQNGKAAKKLRGKYGIKYKSREGLFLIVGHPRIRYHKAIRRDFAAIHTCN